MIVRALEAQDVVRLWETCASLHPVDRVLAILRAGMPERSFEELLEELDEDPTFCPAFAPLVSEDGPDDCPDRLAPDDCPDPELIEPP